MFRLMMAIGAIALLAGGGLLIIQVIEDRGALKAQRAALMTAVAEEVMGRETDQGGVPIPRDRPQRQ